MQAIGTTLAKMHASTIVHGDLTTSNMMLRPLPGQSPNFEVVSHPYPLCAKSRFSWRISAHRY